MTDLSFTRKSLAKTKPYPSKTPPCEYRTCGLAINGPIICPAKAGEPCQKQPVTGLFNETAS